MATTSMSSRLLSRMARSTRRPMRPNPLIATRTAMFPSSSLETRLGRSGHGFGGDAEMLVEIARGRRGTEAPHAYDGISRADIALPTEGGGGFHCHPAAAAAKH